MKSIAGLRFCGLGEREVVLTGHIRAVLSYKYTSKHPPCAGSFAHKYSFLPLTIKCLKTLKKTASHQPVPHSPVVPCHKGCVS